jgi:hypothetical protein
VRLPHHNSQESCDKRHQRRKRIATETSWSSERLENGERGGIQQKQGNDTITTIPHLARGQRICGQNTKGPARLGKVSLETERRLRISTSNHTLSRRSPGSQHRFLERSPNQASLYYHQSYGKFDPARSFQSDRRFFLDLYISVAARPLPIALLTPYSLLNFLLTSSSSSSS